MVMSKTIRLTNAQYAQFQIAWTAVIQLPIVQHAIQGIFYTQIQHQQNVFLIVISLTQHQLIIYYHQLLQHV